MCPMVSKRCGRIACRARILQPTITCRFPFPGRSYSREECVKPDSTSNSSNTVRLAFYCLSDGQPCFHRVCSTGTRRCARTFSAKSSRRSICFLSLEFENVGCFAQKQVRDLLDPNNLPARWTLLVGDNGVESHWPPLQAALWEPFLRASAGLAWSTVRCPSSIPQVIRWGCRGAPPPRPGGRVERMRRLLARYRTVVVVMAAAGY